jgi:hypothetical protein
MVKVSRQYNRIAIQDIDYLRVYLYDFDNSTGEIKHLYNIGDGSNSRMLLGVEFSPDGNQLYFSHHGTGTGTSIPYLYQYDISGPSPLQNTDSPVKYWTTTPNIYTGGGLKMGPDGKMYVTLCYNDQIGVISDPNSTSSLEDRYNNSSAFKLNMTAAYSFQFSTGLTRPAVIICNTNNPPTTQADAVDMCVSATSRTVKVNVLKNDIDIDNDIIYLTGAQFVDSDDGDFATLTVNPADSTLTLTLREDAAIPPEGHVFSIIYDVKDNGTPASVCATGMLTVTAYNTATDSDISVDGESICYGTTATLTASASQSVINPKFRWYASQAAATVLGDEATFTTPALTESTTYYVSVSGDNYCENEAGSRTEVTATVKPLCAHDDHVTVTCETPESFEVLLNDSISENCKSALTLNIIEYPEHGEVDVSGTKIIYTYTGNELAVHDSLTYEIVCGAETSSAKVYFTISHVGSAFVDDVWYFGKNSQGIRFVNNGGVYSAEDASGESKVNSHENSLVVSSPYCDGQTIFYSSHNQTYNSLHEPMQHGHFMGHESVADGLAACYIGENKYLFFSVTDAYGDEHVTPRGLKAYVVDMNADHGRGDIVDSTEIENPALFDMSESIELIAGSTANIYWLVYAYKNGSHHELRVRKIDVSKPFGLDMIGTPLPSPVQTSTTFDNKTYTLKASPQHDRLAIANPDDRRVDVFDFDNTDGSISNRRTTTHSIEGLAYGVEFSPDGKQLYTAGYTTSYGDPTLYQFTIEHTALDYVGHIEYWTYSGSDGHARGGGLKLGPDGKIYVMQSYMSDVGVVLNPDATTPLSERYHFTADITLGVTVNSFALQFSTGLTKPATIICNMNNAPEASPDEAKLCLSPASRSVTVNVIANDVDIDAPLDTIFLTNARFADPTDEALADIAFNAADSTITLTVKQGADIGAAGHIFEIIYDIKDKGLPASQCATGTLTVGVYLPLSYPDVRLRICPDAGEVNLSKYLDTVNGIVESSIQWTSQIPGIPIISPAGTVSSDNLKSGRIYTFTYTLDDMCGTSPQRKVYLEKLTPEKMRPLKDTVVMCYRYAEAVQINQLFGIEANGEWLYSSDFISESGSATYGGAVVMNGKAIYEKAVDDDDFDSYHGNDEVKMVTFTYKAAVDGCLKGREYKVTIVLTENVMN